MARSRREPLVFFPWERKRGLLGTIGRARLRQVMFVALALGFVWLLFHREGRAAAVRATRVAIANAAQAVDVWRGDHGGKCPAAIGDLVSAGYVKDVPRDAWGRPLRLTCPGRKDPQSYELSSDGPDGAPGGLDRVE